VLHPSKSILIILIMLWTPSILTLLAPLAALRSLHRDVIMTADTIIYLQGKAAPPISTVQQPAV
jgi:hypothetical protein